MKLQNYLYHHGIKGQKWGIRRFQNEDGSYTQAGKKKRRYSKSTNEAFTKHLTNRERLRDAERDVYNAWSWYDSDSDEEYERNYAKVKKQQQDDYDTFKTAMSKDRQFQKDLRELRKIYDDDGEFQKKLHQANEKRLTASGEYYDELWRVQNKKGDENKLQELGKKADKLNDDYEKIRKQQNDAAKKVIDSILSETTGNTKLTQRQKELGAEAIDDLLDHAGAYRVYTFKREDSWN